MKLWTKRLNLSAAALIGMVVGGHACIAGDAAPATLAPNRGASFSVGAVRLVTYYRTSGGICNLSVHLAEPTDGVPMTPVTRFEAPVLPGKTVRIAVGSETVEFGCEVGGQTMRVQPLRLVAWAKSTS